MSKYDFNWEGLDLEKYNSFVGWINCGTFSDEFIGCVRVGAICIDFQIRLYEEWEVDYDFYIGGVGDYGFSDVIKDYPYELGEGGSIGDVYSVAELTYEGFMEVVESKLTECIESANYQKYASEPLKIW